MTDQKKVISYFLHIVLPSVGIPDKPSYNMAELRRILGKHRVTIYRMIKAGKLKAVGKDGGDFRIYREELIRYFSDYDEVLDD